MTKAGERSQEKDERMLKTVEEVQSDLGEPIQDKRLTGRIYTWSPKNACVKGSSDVESFGGEMRRHCLCL